MHSDGLSMLLHHSLPVLACDSPRNNGRSLFDHDDEEGLGRGVPISGRSNTSSSEANSWSKPKLVRPSPRPVYRLQTQQ